MVKQTADAIVANGLDRLGYKYVALDDCWSDTNRDENGQLQPVSEHFPNGMRALADYVHSKGLYFGLYTSVGNETCKGKRPGSYGHYSEDAHTLASWGVDMVKMDHCGGRPSGGTDPELYGEMSKALNATGRPILFSLCNWGEENVWEWGGDVAQMYRIQKDHLPFWHYPLKDSDTEGYTRDEAAGVGYGQGTYEVIEWMAHLQPSNWTRPYGWMDPDFLMTEYLTMDFTSSRTEYTFWALWSSPLFISTDLRKVSKKKMEIIANEQVIAISQDLAGMGGDRIFNGTRGDQVWLKKLSNGNKCVVLYNSGVTGKAHVNVQVTWEMIGWDNVGDAKTMVQVYDLWNKEDLGIFMGGYNISVAPRDVQMLRLSLVN